MSVYIFGRWWGSSLCFLAGSSIKLQIMTRKKRYHTVVVWLADTICNTRNILILLCLYLKRWNKLYVGIVWFEGKAPSRTSKTYLTMVEPFAGPSSMAMGNQPMASRYPLCKRLSEGGVQGFSLTLWSGGEIFFFSKYIDFIINLIYYTTWLPPKRLIRACPVLPLPIATPLLHLLRHAGVLLVGCCVIFIRRRPS